MPLPSPYDYDDWRDFAAALISGLGDGTGDVIAAGLSGTSGGGVGPGSGVGGVISPPPGFDFVWYNGSVDSLFLGTDLLTAPPLFSPFQIDTQSLALASVDLTILAANSVNSTHVIDLSLGTLDLANSIISTAKIIDLQVVTAKIADATILSAKIGDLQVITAKIDDLAVNTAKIANLAVNNARIANAAIDNAKIANLAVGAANIIAASIQTAHIVDLNVTGAKIANATIVSANIGALQVVTAAIALLTVFNGNIADAQINYAKIQDGEIGTAKIADANITTAKIADAQITSAKIIDLVVNKITSGTLDAVIDVGTGILRFTIAGNRLSIGKGFGTTSQFIMWFGPDMAENLMTEAAAIFYLKTDGSAYFGGSLLAGTLTNQVQSSGLSATEYVAMGPFGTNGNPRVVTVSVSSSSTNNAYIGGCGGISIPNIQVKLYKGIPFDRSTVMATINATGTVDCDSGIVGDPGFLHKGVGGSATGTDSDATITDQYYWAEITSRNNIAPDTQRLSIVSVEA